MFSLAQLLPLIFVLLLMLAPFAFIASICYWVATRNNPFYTLEHLECRIAPAVADGDGFTLPIQMQEGQRRYVFLAETAAGATRTIPVHYTNLRRMDAEPALLRLTTMKRSKKAENPEQDYLVREAYALVVPPDVVIQDVVDGVKAAPSGAGVAS